MFSGGGSGDYCGIRAAKSQQSQPQAQDDFAASEKNPASSVQQLQQQQQQQPYQKLARASGGSLPSGRQPGNTHTQPQIISTLVEQQPEHKGSSRQQGWLLGEQQVQATEQMLQWPAGSGWWAPGNG